MFDQNRRYYNQSGRRRYQRLVQTVSSLFFKEHRDPRIRFCLGARESFSGGPHLRLLKRGHQRLECLDHTGLVTAFAVWDDLTDHVAAGIQTKLSVTLELEYQHYSLFQTVPEDMLTHVTASLNAAKSPPKWSPSMAFLTSLTAIREKRVMLWHLHKSFMSLCR